VKSLTPNEVHIAGGVDYITIWWWHTTNCIRLLFVRGQRCLPTDWIEQKYDKYSTV